MKISVIIPTLNEARNIRHTLTHVKNLEGDFEIIVVDGGSEDETVKISELSDVNVLSSVKGRGQQMNAGAKIASGDVLLFLHADTQLPDNAYAAIKAALSNKDISGGCFRIQFDYDHPVLNLSSYLSRFPYRLWHYGDACYFVRKEVFEELNGFKSYRIMEDLDFWIRLDKSYTIKILKDSALTSARRFRKYGAFREQGIAAILVWLFVFGVNPEFLAKIYFKGKTDKSTAPVNPYRGVHAFRKPSLWDQLIYPFEWLWRCVYSNLHMTKQTFNVLDFMWWHKVDAGLLDDNHPWLTGIIPGTDSTIWDKNIIFASPRKSKWKGPDPKEDSAIVRQIGMFLSTMVKRSNESEPEIPQGKKRRMPHAVNYIHGTVHYNGAYLIFNDFVDAMYYFSDRNFVKELMRFTRVEKREHTVVIRERAYDPEEYAWFLSFLRARLPWYANANGPTKKRVLHGTPSPYPAVNPINGHWIKDVSNLQKGKMDRLVKPPIRSYEYFNESYCGNQSEYTFIERFHAWGQHLVTTAKGFQGGLVFTSRKKIEPENWVTFQETNGEWRASYPISHPFVSIEKARKKRKKMKQAEFYYKRKPQVIEMV
ncbi:MAG: TIGR04283 family arsenosugar biosynthesis glycosyltransferase [Bacteroidota bacterium]